MSRVRRRWGGPVALSFKSIDSCCTMVGDMNAIVALPCEYHDGGRGRGHAMIGISKTKGGVCLDSAASGLGRANEAKDLTDR